MTYSLAIDLGGVSTSIYRKNQGLVLKEPSLVCATNVGDAYVIKTIGYEAQKMQGKTNDSTYIFSPIICGEVKSVEYASEMLKYFLDKVKTQKVFKENVLLCVPAGITQEEKENFKQVCANAGLGKVAFAPSIICSAYASGMPINSSKTLFAVNIGGTITDIATINMNSILKGATLAMGGRYIDVEIVNMVGKKFKTNISVATAKKIKEEVASLVVNDARTIEVVGTDDEYGKPKRILLSSFEIKPILEKFMNDIIVAIETAINVCPPDVAGDIATTGIFVSGGMANIPGLEKYLKRKLNIDVKIVKENENAVILSAGRLLSDKKTLNSIIENF